MNSEFKVRTAKSVVCAAALSGLIALSGVSHADPITINVNYTFDLTTATITPDGDGGERLNWNPLASPVSIFPITPHAGDTLVTTVSFASGQRLILTDTETGRFPGYESLNVAFFPSDDSVLAKTTGSSIILLGVTGAYSPSPLAALGGCEGWLCQQVIDDWTSTSVGFSGFQITSLVESSGSFPYNRATLLFVSAGDISIDAPASSPAPEPASLALLGLGLAGLGYSRWLKRNRGNLL